MIVIYKALCFDVAHAEWMGHPMRLELTRVGLLVKLANRYTTKGALNNNDRPLIYIETHTNTYTHIYTLHWFPRGWLVKPWIGVWISGFRSQLRESSVSSHTEELWYNETVSLWMTIYLVIYKTRCFDVAQGRMNRAPNETRTHSCRFASLAC